MIDGDPVEAGPEVALRVLHQFAGEGAKVRHLGRVLRRDGEPEMMAILVAPFGESFASASSEAASNIRASGLAGDAVAFQ